MKLSKAAALLTSLMLAFACSVSMAFAADKGKPLPPKPLPHQKPCDRAPGTQVVNNTGMGIFQAKVGGVTFFENLNHCGDGCSTGFQTVNPGENTISVKVRKDSPWIKIGTLGKFEKCRQHAVNLKKRGDNLCAELFVRENTNPTFNADSSKKKIDQTCHALPPVPMKPAKKPGLK